MEMPNDLGVSRYIPAVALTLALLGGVLLALHRAAPTEGSSSDRPTVLALPNLSLPDLQGRPQNLGAFRGHPVFLNMWATWCPPCRAEIPDLEDLYAVNRSKGFLVVGVDQGQDAAPVASFVADDAVNYPVLLDKDQTLSRTAGAQGLPTTLVYDRRGRLVDEVTGMMTPQIMQVELHKAESE